MTSENKVPRWLRSARNRAAAARQKMATATTPAKRLNAARDGLTSAAKHAPADRVRVVADEVMHHAMKVVERVGMPEKSAQWHREHVTDAMTEFDNPAERERARLSRAIRYLAAALAGLPNELLFSWLDHYAEELQKETMSLTRKVERR